MVCERVRPIARSYFDERVLPAHDWHHVERVEVLADRLAADRADVDGTVLGLAVLLHDVGRPAEDVGEIDDHAEWGAREARRVLRDLEVDVDAETIDAVCHCIRAHRYSNDVEPETPAAKVLSDADTLDARGAIGDARTCAHGGELGTPIHDPDLPTDADDSAAGRTSANHLRKKILRLRDRLYTEEGRALVEERHAFVQTFVERLEAEVAGER